MIRGRITYYVAFAAIVSSLIISGCVSAPPATPTPTATPAPTTPMPTPTPSITPIFSVEVLSAPATAVAGQSFMVSWRVNSPVRKNINHTAVHYGPDSKSGNLTLTSYPSLTTVQKGTIPNNFSANITIGKTGIIYFRVHAIIDGTNYWSDEKTITLTVSTNISIKGTPTAMATTGSYVQTFTSQTNTSTPTFSKALTGLTSMTANITDYATQSDPYAINTTGLVGWWHFDENSGIYANDSSGNNNNGRWYGNTSQIWTTGKYNSAGSFNGDNYVIISFAVNGYFYINGDGFHQGKLSFFNTSWVNSNTNLINNTWQYVMVVDNVSAPGTLKFYINGIEAGSFGSQGTESQTFSAWIKPIDVSLSQEIIGIHDGASFSNIGARNNISRFFGGAIDEIIVCKCAWNVSQVQASYYTHLQQLQIKATANGTASANWNGTGSNPLTVPVGSTDTITGLSYSIPSSVVVNGITVNNYNNATKWNLTATANYTIGTGNVQIWGTNVSTAQANVTVTNAPNNVTIST